MSCSGVGEDSLLGQILWPTQGVGIARLKGVPDDLYVRQLDSWVIVGTNATKHMTQGKGCAGTPLFGDDCLRGNEKGRGLQIRHWNTLCQ